MRLGKGVDATQLVGRYLTADTQRLGSRLCICFLRLLFNVANGLDRTRKSLLDLSRESLTSRTDTLDSLAGINQTPTFSDRLSYV